MSANGKLNINTAFQKIKRLIEKNCGSVIFSGKGPG